MAGECRKDLLREVFSFAAKGYRNSPADAIGLVKTALINPGGRPVEVIGLCGLAMVGKSTVALRLIEEHGFRRAKFAGSLKGMLRAFLAYRGASPSTIERMIEGDLKLVPSPLLNGRTPRRAMVTLGTEWGRDLIDPDLWADTEVEHLQSLAVNLAEPRFVFDDLRFPNEVEAIRRLGGKVWRIERDDVVRAERAHVSECLDVVPDVTIRSQVGDFAALWAQIDAHAPAREAGLLWCPCSGNPDCACDSLAPVCVERREAGMPGCQDTGTKPPADCRCLPGKRCQPGLPCPRTA